MSGREDTFEEFGYLLKKKREGKEVTDGHLTVLCMKADYQCTELVRQSEWHDRQSKRLVAEAREFGMLKDMIEMIFQPKKENTNGKQTAARPTTHVDNG